MSTLKIIGWSTLVLGFISPVIALMLFKDCTAQSSFIEYVGKGLIYFSIPEIVVGIGILIIAADNKKV